MFKSITSSNYIQKFKLDQVKCENDYEKQLLSNVMLPDDIGVRFQDIGALDSVKQLLFVIYPLFLGKRCFTIKTTRTVQERSTKEPMQRYSSIWTAWHWKDDVGQGCSY